jgi:lipoprotein-anchoring transpeptidase ErfK/SrfK
MRMGSAPINAPAQSGATTDPLSNAVAAASGATRTPMTTPADSGAQRPTPVPPAQQQAGGAPATPGASTGAPAALPSADAAVGALVARADAAMKQSKFVEARTLLTRALHEPGVTPGAAEAIRERCAAVNDTLVFSPTVAPGDPFAAKYIIQSGDALSLVPRNQGLDVDWRFLKRINGINDENRIIPGQTIKVIRGPFHAVIDKSDFRLDLYLGDSEERVFVRSYRVGLGEQGSTPLGDWVVRPGSKLVNPRWVNPRTGEPFDAADPKNPIGERWIGLDGADPTTRPLTGYGVHGTIDPGSIGREASMGCVRLQQSDVEVIYEVLIEGVSTVRIVP